MSLVAIANTNAVLHFLAASMLIEGANDFSREMDISFSAPVTAENTGVLGRIDKEMDWDGTTVYLLGGTLGTDAGSFFFNFGHLKGMNRNLSHIRNTPEYREKAMRKEITLIRIRFTWLQIF